MDLSKGVDLESAVKSFESKVAPENYKRSSALVSKKQIDDAIDKIDSLGLRSSLQRRHATIEDVSINDVLYVDRGVNHLMRDSLRDCLMEGVALKPVDTGNHIDISIEDFMKDVVPFADNLEILFDKSHISNLVSLTAPVNEKSNPLFKWSSPIAWSYNGGITDSSIKQRVFKAGGKTDGVLRVSLSWKSHDDLDIHIHDPRKRHIYYANRLNLLDVDMNACRIEKDPVENVTWSNPVDGDYKVIVNNFRQRDCSNPEGFVIELDSQGDVEHFEYPHKLRNKRNVICFTMTVKNKKGN